MLINVAISLQNIMGLPLEVSLVSAVNASRKDFTAIESFLSTNSALSIFVKRVDANYVVNQNEEIKGLDVQDYKGWSHTHRL